MSLVPINTIILKVASPCNLNCSYCYEYNKGDSSWKSKPASISSELCSLIGRRIRDYCGALEMPRFGINLHGGEPMLVGPRKIAEIIDTIQESASPVEIRFGMQSNATLTSSEMVGILSERKVKVGVSLDGDNFSNRYRVDHKGIATRDRTVSGISLLRSGGIFSGIQAVIDLDSEPEKVLDALSDFDPPMLELTIPFGNYDNPPQSDPKRHELGGWLLRAFDHWVNTPKLAQIRIRLLQDALEAVLTERPASEWFPSVPPGYVVVATDGSYEGLDTLKVVGKDGRVLHMNVQGATIAEALSHPFIMMRSDAGQLCEECLSCAIVKWCNGGYFPTRYGLGRGFMNPSVYCNEFKTLFEHVGRWLESQPETPHEIRNRISSNLDSMRASMHYAVGPS